MEDWMVLCSNTPSLHIPIPQNFTCGTARSSADSTWKNSAVLKLNMPAMMFVGTLWTFVLKLMVASF